MRNGARRAVQQLTGAAMPGLAARVRWLFLVLLLVVLGIAVLSLPEAPAPLWPHRTVALAAAGVWAGWAWYRYRRPDAPLWTDAVPVVALVVVGISTASPGAVFGPSFVTLFYRSMFGTLRQALVNAMLLGGGFLGVRVLRDGAAAVLDSDGALLAVTYLAVGVVMQALGQAARQHETTAGYERTLAEASRQLLQARTPAAVHQVAVDGALALVDDTATSASLWLGDDVVQLQAAAGPDLIEVEQVSLDLLPGDLLADLLTGRPLVVGLQTIRRLEDALSHPHRFHELLMAPMLRDGQLAGGLLLAGPHAFDRDLVEVLERFANEVTLAVERAELTAQLERANQRLRHADELKNRFLSMVSHELRTPLTAIRGFTQTLREQGDRLTDAERDRFLEIIDRQGSHQQRMVEELLMTSRIISGRTPVEPTDVAWREVVDEAVEELQIDPALVQVDCPATVVVHADPSHLRQVLANLVTNARKYGAPPLHVEVAEGDGHHVLRVRDHGPGIDPAFREFLFDPFRQGGEHCGPASSGVGLGLAIVEGLVRANHGTIRYVPADPGAAFEVTLPAAAPAPVHDGAAPGWPGDPASARVPDAPEVTTVTVHR